MTTKERAKELGKETVFSQDSTLTRREYFAGLMMQALISNPERYKYIAEKVENGMSNKEASEKNAHKAVLLADALLDELCMEG